MIEARGLTKRFGPRLAVDGLSFAVRPGRVTGFLGPNGSGKSTTMRLILGLDRPDAGQARIGGRLRTLRSTWWTLAITVQRGHRRGLVISGGAVEKHVASIFAKLGLPAGEADNRRVLAVLRYVGA